MQMPGLVKKSMIVSLFSVFCKFLVVKIVDLPEGQMLNNVHNSLQSPSERTPIVLLAKPGRWHPYYQLLLLLPHKLENADAGLECVRYEGAI